MSRRRAACVRLGSGVAVALVAASMSLVAQSSTATASEPAMTLSDDQSIDSYGRLHPTAGACSGYTIPPGVTEVDVRVIGGNGNPGRTVLGHGGGVGGRGADLTVERVRVTPGQRLYFGSAPGGRPRYLESEAWSPGAGGDGAWVSTHVGPGCTPDEVIAFAGGGGGGGDGDINGPGGTGGNADARGNDGSGSGSGRAGKGGQPGTLTAGGPGGAGGSVFDITCFCTEHGEAGTAGQSVSLPTTSSLEIGTDGRQTGGLGGQELTGGAMPQNTWGGSGGGGYYGGGGGGASFGWPTPGNLDGSGPLAGAGSGGGGGGSSTPIEAATLSTVAHAAGTNTLSEVVVWARWTTTTTVTSSLSPAQPGQPVTLTARVATVHPFGARQLRGGTVTFDDIGTAQANGSNGTRLGSAPIVVGPDGQATATLTVPSFTGGDHRTRVRFGGYSPFEDGSPLVLPSIGFVDQVGVAQQTLSFTSTPGSRAAYGDPYTASAESTSGLPVTVTVDPTAATVCGIDPSTPSRVSFFSAGTCVLNADQAGSPEFFEATRVQQSFAVATGTPPEQQVITFTSSPPENLVRGSLYTVSAVGGGSGNPVKFSASSPFGTCELVSIDVIRIYAGGNCRITASQDAGPGFLAATATQELFVASAPQNITAVSTAPSSLAVGSTYTMVVAVDSARLATFGTGPGSSGCTVVRVPPTSAGNATSSAVVTATSPGLCVVTAQETTDDVYYDPSPVLTQSVPIGIAQTAAFTSAAPQDAVVGSSYTPTTSGGASGQPVVVASSSPLACTVKSGVVTFVSSGVCVLTADQAGDSTHALAPQATQSLIVGRAPQTIAFTSTAPDGAVVGDAYTPTFQSGTSIARLSLSTATPDTCLVVGGVVTFTGGGTCTLTADQPGDAGYLAAPQVSQHVTVGPGAQSVTFTSNTPPQPVVGSTYSPTASSSSGLPVTFGATGSCVLSEDVVTFTRLGTCTVTADQGGNADYTAAPRQSQTISVGDSTAPALLVPPDVTVEATGPDGAVATFVASATDAVDGSVDVSCSSGSKTTFGLGSTTVACSATDASGNTGSATFTVTVVDTTAPVVTVPADMTLEATGPDGAVATFEVSADDLVDGSTAIACSPSSESTFVVGTTSVRCWSTDAAGNTGSASFNVTAEGTGAQLTDLQAEVQRVVLDDRIAKNLQSIIQSAHKAMAKGDTAAVCDKLTSFVSQVQAQSGKKIAALVAVELIADAQRIQAVLDCP